ncbi:MAG: F0F1 ATP synthase subunit A [Oscillospiraceae bacterium]|nr:F0F1 ATP synthase subunit A [Oscillospiraceae bacterium]
MVVLEIEVSIMPHEFFIGPVNVGLSVVVAWCVIAVIIVLLLLAQLRIRKFTTKPKGLQLVLELIVENVKKFSVSQGGHKAGYAAPAILTMMVYVFFTTLPELFGLPPATEDINCTLALGLCAFITVNATAVHALGVRGRLRAWAQPVAAVAPIRVLTDMIAPFSMAIRLFANVLAGGVLMKLIYMALPVVLPAALSAYFNVLHVMIQTFVFGMLTLLYISEATE